MNSMTTRNFPWWTLWLIPIIVFGLALFSISDTDLFFDWIGLDIHDLANLPLIGGWLDGVADRDMLMPWLEREGGKVFSWWLLVTLAGAGALPLLYRLLPSLPDRGYSVSRTAGLMFTGFLYWFMTSLSLTRNEIGTIILAWLLVLMVGVVVWLRWEMRPTRAELRAWFSENLPIIVITEVLFLVAFVGWAYIQAHNPEVGSTEKPMEMTFINGIRNSATFPPKDPWLSGYSISYYYFGYVIIAGLADLSNVATGIAFNLATALVFALSAIGITGLLYNLVRSRGPLERWRPGTRGAAVGIGLLAALMLVLMGNLSTVLVELPYRGYASQLDFVDQDYFLFWDVKDRDLGGPNNPGIIDANNDGTPDWDGKRLSMEQWTNRGYWWWFPHSRVVQDRNFDQNLSGEPIVEFPNFSFILADNHPHVLALPFAILALTLAAGLALRRDSLLLWEIGLFAVVGGGMVFMNAWDAIYIIIMIAAEALRRLIRNGTGHLSGFGDLIDVVSLSERRERNLMLAVPVYIVLILVIAVFKLAIFSGISFWIGLLVATILAPFVTLLTNWALGDHDLGGVARFGAVLSVVAYFLYLPWYIGFTSQANGIYPNIIYATRAQQFFNQFGIFLVILAFFLVLEMVRFFHRINWTIVVVVVLIGLIVMLGVPVLSTYALDARCPLRVDETGAIFNENDPAVAYETIEMTDLENDACQARQQLFGTYQRPNEDLYRNVLSRRGNALPTQFFLLIVIGFVAARLFTRPDAAEPVPFSPSTAVILLLLAAGAVIALAPDLFYIRDNFNWRMNTIFKMYYQVWLLFSIASAYAIYRLITNPPRLAVESVRTMGSDGLARTLIVGAIVAIMVLAGLLYPYYAIQSRYLRDTGRINAANDDPSLANNPLTLNGARRAISSSEWKVVQCLSQAAGHQSDAVIVEAPYDGGYWSRGNYGRFSMLSGIPTLMGWANHEGQWRGESYSEIDGVGARQRITDADLLYRTTEWEQAQTLIDRYGIDYVVVGDLERTKYSDSQRGLDKFADIFDPVCQSGAVAVYYVGTE